MGLCNMQHGESRQATEAEARVEGSAVELEEEWQNGRTQERTMIILNRQPRAPKQTGAAEEAQLNTTEKRPNWYSPP